MMPDQGPTPDLPNLPHQSGDCLGSQTVARIRPKCVPKWTSGSEIGAAWSLFLHLGRGRVLEATDEETMLSSKTQHQAFGEKDIKGLFLFLKYCYVSIYRVFVFHIHSTFFLWASDVLKERVWVRRKRPESQYPEVPHNRESCSPRGTEQPQSMDFQGRDLNLFAPGEILTAGPLIPWNKPGWPESCGQGNGPGTSHNSLLGAFILSRFVSMEISTCLFPLGSLGSQGVESIS